MTEINLKLNEIDKHKEAAPKLSVELNHILLRRNAIRDEIAKLVKPSHVGQPKIFEETNEATAATEIKTLHEKLTTVSVVDTLAENFRKEIHDVVALHLPYIKVDAPPNTYKIHHESIDQMKRTLIRPAPAHAPPAAPAAAPQQQKGWWGRGGGDLISLAKFAVVTLPVKTWQTINDLPTAAKIAGAGAAIATTAGAIFPPVHAALSQTPIIGSAYGWTTARAAEIFPVIAEKTGFTALLNPALGTAAAAILGTAAGVWFVGRVKQEAMKVINPKKKKEQEGSAFIAGAKFLGEVVTSPFWIPARVIGWTIGKTTVTVKKPIVWVWKNKLHAAVTAASTVAGGVVGATILPTVIFTGANPLFWIPVATLAGGYMGHRAYKKLWKDEHGHEHKEHEKEHGNEHPEEEHPSPAPTAPAPAGAQAPAPAAAH